MWQNHWLVHRVSDTEFDISFYISKMKIYFQWLSRHRVYGHLHEHGIYILSIRCLFHRAMILMTIDMLNLIHSH